MDPAALAVRAGDLAVGALTPFHLDFIALDEVSDLETVDLVRTVEQ